MKKTSEYLRTRKSRGERIAMLTCYDFPTALWEEQAGVDVMLVGDSVGTNVLGYESVREVTLDDVIHHVKATRRGVSTAYLLADLPSGTYDEAADALLHAGALLRAGADGVKLEGFRPEIVSYLTDRGVDVCAHLGLNPQVHEKHALQAKTADAALQLIDESAALEAAGAFMIVYELIPEEVAREATQRLGIPTIGIGAGRYTDGQVLVVHDALGANAFELRHSRKYEDLRGRGTQAMRAYVEDVHSGRFPEATNVRHLPEAEAAFARRARRRVQDVPSGRNASARPADPSREQQDFDEWCGHMAYHE
ncbi:MAG: 3-methyl-2-oxobutanoate hydroxymethyltransferase [Phycisphaerales bacterium]|nr:MAG: 3-methyl-2-oxobutanoate hydroxymethyltransferase [Phycisphaerales bacterium]